MQDQLLWGKSGYLVVAAVLSFMFWSWVSSDGQKRQSHRAEEKRLMGRF